MLRGGATPSICEGKYTGQKSAEKELVKYLKKTDRLGYAVYPNKDN